jgi:membrane associated rhomboid family serine protease
MLIIPFDKKLSWNNPPYLTFILIFINTIIYFSFQFHDDDKFIEASHYFYRSGLFKIELPLFKEALVEQGEFNFLFEWEDDTGEGSPWFFHMESNKYFMQALKNEQLITPKNPYYKIWKSKRAELDKLLNDIVTWSYSFRAGKPTLITFFTHIFLHGDMSHLVGNMLFLLALGFIVELSISRSLYLPWYLLCGVFSALFNIPFYSNSLTPSLGASGAIAGLMGMYTVLFNVRKIRFFYFIYVYFDYVKLPAICLLPLWLGHEIYQQIAYSDTSNVNYLAHIGGLISGTILASILLKLQPNKINYEYIDENNKNELFRESLNKAESLIRELQHEKAVPILRRLLADKPDNKEVIYKFYQASKLESNSEAHHEASLKILTLTDTDAATNQLIKETLNDYIKLKKPRITAEIIGSLTNRFANAGFVDEAEKLITIMLKHPQKFIQLPQHLLKFVDCLMREGRRGKAIKYTDYLTKVYPGSQEQQFARKLIRQ